jgi:uncharacterized protein
MRFLPGLHRQVADVPAPPSRRDILASFAVLTLGPATLARAEGVLTPLAIVTASGQRHVFEVEFANTDESRARGLMFRRYMAPNRGMLFDFGAEREVGMWMQNTYIPLDMLFIRADGIVTRIEERTEPLSTRTISSGGPVRSVLELNGGLTANLGIRAGDRVEHAMFPTKK